MQVRLSSAVFEKARREAKKLVKQEGMKLYQARDRVAVSMGYSDWREMASLYNRRFNNPPRGSQRRVPQAFLSGINPQLVTPATQPRQNLSPELFAAIPSYFRGALFAPPFLDQWEERTDRKQAEKEAADEAAEAQREAEEDARFEYEQQLREAEEARKRELDEIAAELRREEYARLAAVKDFLNEQAADDLARRGPPEQQSDEDLHIEWLNEQEDLRDAAEAAAEEAARDEEERLAEEREAAWHDDNWNEGPELAKNEPASLIQSIDVNFLFETLFPHPLTVRLGLNDGRAIKSRRLLQMLRKMAARGDGQAKYKLEQFEKTADHKQNSKNERRDLEAALLQADARGYLVRGAPGCSCLFVLRTLDVEAGGPSVYYILDEKDDIHRGDCRICSRTTDFWMASIPADGGENSQTNSSESAVKSQAVPEGKTEGSGLALASKG